MMKNKKLTWILGPAVLVIWGLIIYRVMAAVKGNSESYALPAPSLPVTVPMADTASYVLNLDYDDPFLKGHRRAVVAQRPAPSQVKKAQKPKVVKVVKKLPLKWPAIQYQGIIEKNSQRLCLLTRDGAALFMAPGQVDGDLKLLAVYPDSIRVEYRGEEKRTIPKQ